MTEYRRNLLLAIVFVVMFASSQRTAYAGAADDQEIALEVATRGDLVIVDAQFVVPATPAEAWDVLTDYAHMADFLPYLESSEIIESTGNKVRIAQKGRAAYGLLAFSFDSVREVELKPFEEIRSRVVGGSIPKSDGVTRLAPEGNGTRIIYHNESVPNVRFSRSLIAGFAEKTAREQLENLKKEILRRQTAANK